MKHCIQINVGSKKYTFNIDVSKEADLTASFPDIISKYILKDKSNISILEEITNSLNGEHNSSSGLKNILNKEVLSDSEISKLLDSYAGNSSIYNIASYFNASRRSDKVLLLSNVLGSRGVINTSNYDVILMDGARNRVLTKNNRTMLILNPESQPEEALSLLSTVYTLNQLREPNSWIFKQFSKVIEDYSGELYKDIKDLSMMDKAIYLFANPNLEQSVRDSLNGLINQDINTKIKLTDKIKLSGSHQENALFDIMVDDRNAIITNSDGTIGVSVKDIINFKNGLWNSYTVKATEEEFKEAFGLEEVDTTIYRKDLWGYLIKHKDVAEVVYDKLNSSTIKKDNIKDRLMEASKLLLIDNISIPESELSFTPDPSKLDIEPGTRFGQNRMIKIRYTASRLNFKSLIVSSSASNVSYDGGQESVTIPLEMALNNSSEVKVLLNKYGLYNLKFEGNISLSKTENVFKLYRENLSYLTIKDGSANDIEYVKQANRFGYQVNLYAGSDSNMDNVLSKYTSIMPVFVKPLAAKYKPLSYQSNVFSSIATKPTLVPVTSSNESMNQYSIGESFKLYNEKNPNITVGVTLTEKIPLYHQYYLSENNASIEQGDLILKTGRHYIFVERIDENSIKCIDLDSSEPTITTVNLEYVEQGLQNGMKVATPVNEDGIIWYRDTNGREHFYSVEEDTFSNLSKEDFFKPRIEEFSKDSGIPVESLNKLLRDNKKRLLFRLSPSDYSERSVVHPVTGDFKYYTTQDLVERINTRLTKGTIPVIWFNRKSTKADLGFSIKDLKNFKAFTHDGIIYMNEDLSTIDSYVHELSHIILAALRTQDTNAYNILLSKINEIPEGFSSTYQGLTQNDLKEEYLVHLFSSYFTDIDSSAVTDTMDSIDWETVVKKIFKLPEDLNDSEVMRLMNDTIRNMLSSTEDSFTYSEIFKENKFQQLTKLAALKKELMKNNTLREEC